MAEDRPTYYRYDTTLTNAHQIHLTSTHEGEYTSYYQDDNRCICLDCLAAIGMLEFNKKTEREDTVSLQSRLSPIQSLRGGD